MAKKTFTAPERTFERGRGCWNCVSFENGDLSRQHWLTHRNRLIASLATSAPITRLGEMEEPVPSGRDARLAQVHQMDKAVQIGVVGMCMKGSRPQSLGGPEGDFVEHRFLCDRWVGRQGSSVATSGRPLDKLNEELREIADDRATNK